MTFPLRNSEIELDDSLRSPDLLRIRKGGSRYHISNELHFINQNQEVYEQNNSCHAGEVTISNKPFQIDSYSNEVLAADTLSLTFLSKLHTNAGYFDRIIQGDVGRIKNPH